MYTYVYGKHSRTYDVMFAGKLTEVSLYEFSVSHQDLLYRLHTKPIRYAVIFSSCELIFVIVVYIISVLVIRKSKLDPLGVEIAITTGLRGYRAAATSYRTSVAKISRLILNSTLTLSLTLSQKISISICTGCAAHKWAWPYTNCQYKDGSFLRGVSSTNLGESGHVSFDDVRMRTLQLLDDVETLIELSKNIGHRTGEQDMFGRLLKLYTPRTYHIS